MVDEVLDCNGYTGLTVGARVLAPGSKFDEKLWPYGAELLAVAVKNGRCKQCSVSQPEQAKPVKPAKEDK